MMCNGSYKDEETAAHASDTLARKFMANDEYGHKLNFPDDCTEVYPEKKQASSKFIGVSYDKKNSNWKVSRRSKKCRKNMVDNGGTYKDEETAAHASDTLARNLMTKGEYHKLNFSGDGGEMHIEKKQNSSKYIGESYDSKNSRWKMSRRSKNETRMIYNRTYKDKETAAHASDTLERKLMANGEYDDAQMYPKEARKNKRKRPNGLVGPPTDENFEQFE
jgi:hypothetical protein